MMRDQPCRNLAQVVREMQVVAAAGLKPSQHRALNQQGLAGTHDSEAASAADQQSASQRTSPTKQGQGGNATGNDTIDGHAAVAEHGVVDAQGRDAPPYSPTTSSFTRGRPKRPSCPT